MARITLDSSLPGIYYNNNTLVNRVYYNGRLVYLRREPTITFDSTGGSKVDPMTTIIGKLSWIPTPTYYGHRFEFEGWYYLDDNNNEILVSTSTVFTQDTTVFAKWTKISDGYEYFPDAADGWIDTYDDEHYWNQGFNSGTRHFIINGVVLKEDGYPYQECEPGMKWKEWIGEGRCIGYWNPQGSIFDISKEVYISINLKYQIQMHVLTVNGYEFLQVLNYADPDDEIGWNTY